MSKREGDLEEEEIANKKAKAGTVLRSTESAQDLFNLPLTELFVILDVRRREEYLQSHISGAEHFPAEQESKEADLEGLLCKIFDPQSGTDINQAQRMCVYSSAAKEEECPGKRLVELILSKGVTDGGSRCVRPKLLIHMYGNGFSEFCQQHSQLVTYSSPEPYLLDSPLLRVHVPSKITPWGLYLGAQTQASDLELLRLLDIGLVINLTKEVPNYFESSADLDPPIKYLKLEALDEDEQPMRAIWEATLSAILSAHAAGPPHRGVLVHCHAGRSRSASAVVYCFMRAGCLDLKSALAFVQRCRPIAEPNEGFMRQLAEVEAEAEAEAQKKGHPAFTTTKLISS